MKNKIKDFLFKRRIKILKNKKGFTLMEVLVAVGLIGIITAIAVPQFQDYREQTGLVAGNTSTSNMARAYQNCMALNAFSDCNSLQDISIECNGCTDGSNSRTEPPFCANYLNDAGGKTFRMCVSVDANNKVTKTIGGAFKVCHETCAGNGCANTNANLTQTIKRCKNDTTDCAGVKKANVAQDPNDQANTGETYTTSCKENPSQTAGTCDSSGNGTCG